MTAVWGAEPCGGVPLSLAVTLMVADPLALAAGVKVSVPSAATAGWVENRPLLLLVTLKWTVWLDSLAGPADMAVAHPEKLCAPASSATVLSGPLVKLGAS